ncbi:CatB-related O-acetyltransferase [Bdellovibrio svalbardensis]|uniref:CatB-related O-acetyltransferase n=1 Tax=Bdellovibrio svalbardensis TaxID=2972972 RepID=A0ABT6DKE6_9BACT|nr:CatB-related O-acetyltransferase [Bdellovibrio svalbardensis]MDG0817346.1 CatB-related O-acetyltransferase [Bdellovibrio svalbardensis]
MFKTLLKKIYFCYFAITKRFKYPTCILQTNFILPGVKLGRHVIIENRCKVYRNVMIGDYTFINENTRIDPNTKSIGKFCSISHDVKIGMGPHPLAFVSTSPVFYSKARGFVGADLYDEYADKGYTEIGNDVFIACNAVVLAGVKIGHGAVVTASSVVIKDVPPYAVVGGNPAKLIKFRFAEDEIVQLLKSKWWDMDLKTLLKSPEQMTSVRKFIDSGVGLK